MVEMQDVSRMAQEWIDAKAAETKAVEKRRALEDELNKALDIGILEGSETFKHDGYIIKMVGRIDRKVDGAKVQELAAAHNLTEHLSTLFRWKPEINAAAWKNTNPAITDCLLDAITSTPGRTSFTITHKEI
jgi:hypothetical protein